jgi:hypothetical protein
VLLSDPGVKDFLANQVVPTWQSIRSAPKVKIDFGNGKVMERTLKGNTVLYLCKPGGEVIDAFPGVYTPADFLAEVQPAMEKWQQSDLAKWHEELVKLKIFQEQMRITMSKARVESPLLDALGFSRQPRSGPGKLPETPADSYEKLVRKLDDLSDEPLKPAAAAKQVAPQAGTPEQIAEAAVRNDSRQNVRLVRPAIHLLLAKYAQSPKIDQIDKKIYKEILKLNVDDPYLGLGELVLPGTPPPLPKGS